MFVHFVLRENKKINSAQIVRKLSHSPTFKNKQN